MDTDKNKSDKPDKSVPEKRTEAFAEYGIEYEFKLIARMLSRGLPYDMIAGAVKIPIQEVVRRASVLRDNPDILTKGDLLQGLGDSDSAVEYVNQEVMASLLQLSAASSTPAATKVSALSKALEMNTTISKSKQVFDLSYLTRPNIN